MIGTKHITGYVADLLAHPQRCLRFDSVKRDISSLLRECMEHAVERPARAGGGVPFCPEENDRFMSRFNAGSVVVYVDYGGHGELLALCAAGRCLSLSRGFQGANERGAKTFGVLLDALGVQPEFLPDSSTTHSVLMSLHLYPDTVHSAQLGEPSYSPEIDGAVDEIYRACKGFGTDQTALIATLGSKDAEERFLIASL